MKKYMLVAALAAVGFVTINGAIAEDKSDKKEWMSEQQKECVKSYDCPKFTKEEKEIKTDEEFQAKYECKQRAFESCGVEVPADKMERMNKFKKAE